MSGTAAARPMRIHDAPERGKQLRRAMHLSEDHELPRLSAQVGISIVELAKVGGSLQVEVDGALSPGIGNGAGQRGGCRAEADGIDLLECRDTPCKAMPNMIA